VCCSHSVAVGESNSVVGGNGLLVDTRGLMAEKVVGASGAGYAVSSKGGN
jgi:hypothetical protein